jgi:hypothetical protein
MADGKLVVCVPARNEEERLPRLIDALSRQTIDDATVVVSLNNTTDRSKDAVAAASRRYPALNLVLDEVVFAPADAHAGNARRRAMDLAADIAGPAGYVLTTDADTRPPEDWLAANLAAISSGFDVVGGRIAIDRSEPLSDAVTALGLLTDRYWAHVREIEDAVDPVPWDPPPRHGDHTGASLCVTVSAYRQCGGVPAIPSSEDRALVQAIVRCGGRLAHPASIWTRASPRTVGRAAGGMAEHMMRLEGLCGTDGRIMLPSFAQWRLRAAWRRDARRRGGAALVAELEELLPPMIDDTVLREALFEAAG